MTLPPLGVDFSCCTTRHLPPPLRLKAAWASAVARPENAPGLIDLAYNTSHDQPLPPAAITLLKGKFWPNASKIKVAFSGGSRQVNAKVLQYASMWSKWANLDFVDVGPRDDWDILVGYDQPGYWSLIGTDSRFARQQGEQSLNLEGFDRGMPESEWARVVCHEFGHALGAMHEQMRPEVVRRLDRQRCYAYFARTQGWDRQMVDEQILTPLDLNTTVFSTEDDTSIMMYAFPPAVTVDGRGIVGGDRINDLDGKTIATVYPGRGKIHVGFANFIDAL